MRAGPATPKQIGNENMLFDAALSSWLHGRRHTMTFHGPPDTRRMLAALLTQMYDKDIEWRSEWEPAHGGWAPTVAQDVAPGVVRAAADWRVLAEPVVHGHGLDVSQAFLERWICYGYRVETQSKVIAISGDTVGKIAAACNVKTLVLTQHRPRSDVEMIERLRDEVSRDFSGRLTIANDLDEIVV